MDTEKRSVVARGGTGEVRNNRQSRDFRAIKILCAIL